MGDEAAAERRLIIVQGIVQGVGFRPFVYGLALRLGLAGFVVNDSAGVTIEVEGPPQALDAFAAAVRDQAPPLARVDAVRSAPLPAMGSSGFQIGRSSAGAARRTLIAPDSATCPDCLRELRDPGDRRFGYAFLNCTNCGPRFTIVTDIPYDRANTTMAGFPLCPTCAAEYADPLDRRFHAQPSACAACGPSLRWEPARPGADPIDSAAEALAAGQTVAVKGLGGYHLACDATSDGAVRRLRGRKAREAKPFALMVADLDTARRLCRIDPAEAALIESRRRPIVLLARHPDGAASLPLAPAVAPGHATLGLMLPYTPLHHLLLAACAARGVPALVLTSGNLSDEPIAYADDDARARLAPIADATLSHNRPIHMRCDDSVTRVVAGEEQLLRRSRGYAPEPLRLGLAAPRPILAYGGHQKNSFCLARETMYVLSHHIGDLENLETLTSLREGIAHFQRLFEIAPEALAYDLHPEYLATKEALAAPTPIKIGVQHHHAHIASVLAEHGLQGPVIGVAADGTGYGLDGTIWGGEILVATLAGFSRAGHLAPVSLPGGEQAVRQPWRVAAAYLSQSLGPGWLELDIPFVRGLDRGRWAVLERMIERGVNSPRSSSMGRLFDAVAALLGLHPEAAYEGQAAIALEQLAEPSDEGYPFSLLAGAPFQLDMAPAFWAIVADLRSGVGASQIAGRFHRTVALGLLEACRAVRADTGLADVALSGGVFQNRLLLEQLQAMLLADGFTVYRNRLVPPNDGGLSLGQAAVAAARLMSVERKA